MPTYSSFFDSLDSKSLKELQTIQNDMNNTVSEFKTLYSIDDVDMDADDLDEASEKVKKLIENKTMSDEDEPKKRKRRQDDTPSTYTASKQTKSDPRPAELQSIYEVGDTSESVALSLGYHDDFFGIHKLLSGHLMPVIPKIRSRESDGNFVKRVESVITESFEKSSGDYGKASGERSIISKINELIKTFSVFDKCLGFSICYQSAYHGGYIEDTSIGLKDFIGTKVPTLFLWKCIAEVNRLNPKTENSNTVIDLIDELNQSTKRSSVMHGKKDTPILKDLFAKMNILLTRLKNYNVDQRKIVLKLRDDGKLVERYCVPYSVILASVRDKDILAYLESKADVAELFNKLNKNMDKKYSDEKQLNLWFKYADDETKAVHLSTSKDHQMEVLYYYLGHITKDISRFLNDNDQNENAYSNHVKFSLSYKDKNSKQLDKETIEYIGELIEEPQKSIRKTPLTLTQMDKILISRLLTVGLGVGKQVGKSLNEVKDKLNLTSFAMESAYKPYYYCHIKAKGKKRRGYKLLRKRVPLRQYCNDVFDNQSFFKWKTHQLVDIPLVAKLLVEGLIPLRTAYSESDVHIVNIGSLPVNCFPILLGVHDLPTASRSRTLNEYLLKNSDMITKRTSIHRKLHSYLKVISEQHLKFVKQSGHIDCLYRNVAGTISQDSITRLLIEVNENVKQTSSNIDSSISDIIKDLKTRIKALVEGCSSRSLKTYLGHTVYILHTINLLRTLILRLSEFKNLECPLLNMSKLQQLFNRFSVVLQYLEFKKPKNGFKDQKLRSYLNLLTSSFEEEKFNTVELKKVWMEVLEQLQYAERDSTTIEVKLVDVLTRTLFTPCDHVVQNIDNSLLPFKARKNEPVLVGDEMFSMEELSQLACCSSDCEEEHIETEFSEESDSEEDCGDEQDYCGDEQDYCGDEQEDCGDEQDYCSDEQEDCGDEQDYCGSEFETLVFEDSTSSKTTTSSKISAMNFGVANDLDTAAFQY